MTGATYFNIRYRRDGTSSWSYKREYDETRTYKWIYSVLESGETYEFGARSQCDYGASAYSPIQTFTTSLCTTPDNVHYESLTNTSVKIDWVTVPNRYNYKLQYKKATNSSWTTKYRTSSYRWVTSLYPGTQYEYRVRSRCDDTEGDRYNSLYSSTQTFTTTTSRELELMGEEKGMEINLFPNPADEFIYLNYSLPSDEKAEMKVLDMYGKIVTYQQLETQEGTLKLNTNNLPSGHYLLQIQTGEEMMVKRFVIIE
jgi:hypothetical protein